MKRLGTLIGTLAIVGVSLSHTALADQSSVIISGSSTVAPFANRVAEQLGNQPGHATPEVRSVGSSAGIKHLSAVTVAAASIATASRRIKDREIAHCMDSGIDVVELKVGADGIVVAVNQSSSLQSLNLQQLYLAMGHKVPKNGKKPTFNAHRSWRDIDSDLPNDTIRILGPSDQHGTYGALQEMVLGAGCQTFPRLAELHDSQMAFDRISYGVYCEMFRQDGSYEMFDRYDQLLQTLLNDSEAVAFLPYSLFEKNRGQLRALAIDGVAPTPAAVAADRYPLARPLYLYINKSRLANNPAVANYVAEFTREGAWSETGYLAVMGLIPLPEAERAQGRRAVQQQIALRL